MSFARKIRRRMEKKDAATSIGGTMINCNTHRKVPWKGDIVCDGCHRVHLIDETTLEFSTVVDDLCGYCEARLFPARDDEGKPIPSVPFYGRIACRSCAVERYEQHKNDPLVGVGGTLPKVDGE